jgi:hypothetical protein
MFTAGVLQYTASKVVAICPSSLDETTDLNNFDFILPEKVGKSDSEI